jgi:hypothetical protein
MRLIADFEFRFFSVVYFATLLVYRQKKASNGNTTDEWERIWEEAVVA